MIFGSLTDKLSANLDGRRIALNKQVGHLIELLHHFRLIMGVN